MKRGACVTLPIIWILLIFIFRTEAGTKWQKGEDKKQEKLICYLCNSLYDTRCADPFDPYTLGSVDCSMRRAPDHLNSTLKSSFCRKTTQKVQGKIRVIRGCGFVADNRECFTKSGTHEVQITYCACNTTYCNEATSLFYPSISVFVTLIPFIASKIY